MEVIKSTTAYCHYFFVFMQRLFAWNIAETAQNPLNELPFIIIQVYVILSLHNYRLMILSGLIFSDIFTLYLDDHMMSSPRLYRKWGQSVFCWFQTQVNCVRNQHYSSAVYVMGVTNVLHFMRILEEFRSSQSRHVHMF